MKSDYTIIYRYLSKWYDERDLCIDNDAVLFGGDYHEWGYMIEYTTDNQYKLTYLHYTTLPIPVIHSCNTQDQMVKFLDIFLIQVL